ncbi:MAG: hypothetical protein K8R88_10030 [Armatimonadetes bacterium]|nr:hypothetical protein [Armatimonadota bacterium]
MESSSLVDSGLQGAIQGVVIAGGVIVVFLGFASFKKANTHLGKLSNTPVAFPVKLTEDEAFARVKTFGLSSAYKLGAENSNSRQVVLDEKMSLTSFGCFHAIRIFAGPYGLTNVEVSHHRKVPQYGPIPRKKEAEFMSALRAHFGEAIT